MIAFPFDPGSRIKKEPGLVHAELVHGKAPSDEILWEQLLLVDHIHWHRRHHVGWETVHCAISILVLVHPDLSPIDPVASVDRNAAAVVRIQLAVFMLGRRCGSKFGHGLVPKKACKL